MRVASSEFKSGKPLSRHIGTIMYISVIAHNQLPVINNSCWKLFSRSFRTDRPSFISCYRVVLPPRRDTKFSSMLMSLKYLFFILLLSVFTSFRISRKFHRPIKLRISIFQDFIAANFLRIQIGI